MDQNTRSKNLRKKFSKKNSIKFLLVWKFWEFLSEFFYHISFIQCLEGWFVSSVSFNIWISRVSESLFTYWDEIGFCSSKFDSMRSFCLFLFPVAFLAQSKFNRILKEAIPRREQEVTSSLSGAWNSTVSLHLTWQMQFPINQYQLIRAQADLHAQATFTDQ